MTPLLYRTNKPVAIIVLCMLMFMTSTYFRKNKRIHFSQIHIKKLPLNTLSKLQKLIACKNKEFRLAIETRNEFWVLKNFVRADHGSIQCHETVTFTTHATVDYLDHLEELVVQWRAPISLAIHAPGQDFDTVVDSINYLRTCLENSDIIKEMVTFHIFFSFKHFPKNFRHSRDFIFDDDICMGEPPYLVEPKSTHMQKYRLLYPINIARNIARDAALTHFVLSSDIDFYPSPNLPSKFLKMIAGNEWPLDIPTAFPKVFPLALFQLNHNSSIPSTKLELKEMLTNKSASFYSDTIPDILKWIEIKESDEMHAQLQDTNELWVPIFIGTHHDPHYENRLSWEGQNDRITQAYIMCVQNYRYLILNDVFLVHSANFKPYRYRRRKGIINQQLEFLNSVLRPQLERLYGKNSHCSI